MGRGRFVPLLVPALVRGSGGDCDGGRLEFGTLAPSMKFDISEEGGIGREMKKRELPGLVAVENKNRGNK